MSSICYKHLLLLVASFLSTLLVVYSEEKKLLILCDPLYHYFSLKFVLHFVHSKKHFPILRLWRYAILFSWGFIVSSFTFRATTTWNLFICLLFGGLLWSRESFHSFRKDSHWPSIEKISSEAVFLFGIKWPCMYGFLGLYLFYLCIQVAMT